jgi:hypothetical protein
MKYSDNAESFAFVEKTTLSEYGKIDEALLPAGDCIFFVLPIKNKAGLDLNSIEELKTLNYNELRTYCALINEVKDAKIDQSGSRVDILNRAIKFTQAQLKVNTKAKKVEEAKEVIVDNSINELLLDAINLIEKAIELSKDNNSQLADGITYEELHEEALRLKAILN